MTRDDPVVILSEEECWRRLRRLEFGRLAFHLSDEVHIVPINYAVDRARRIVFRTAEGSKLLGVVMDSDVAFEIDEIVGEEYAWSVIARGRATILEGDEARDTDNLRLRPWLPTEKNHVVAISVEEISGRSFTLDRPWLHLR